ncbi:CHASE domain-containing protein [uncultured Hoeflea sp.]|uniref:CHASE domain-containing protein n=1 Tax=uncultured Hoeflea sp. TaxID=538666 RepID=UPI0030DDB06B
MESDRKVMMRNSIGMYLVRILLIAGLYFASGRLGLFLAVPPGFATVIWPPSGIALGVLIICGWRHWPGILLGSFLVNCYISNAYSPETGLDLAKALIALAIAAGSSLQALAGFGLVSRFLGLPLSFDRLRQVMLLFIIAGPIACLVAATAGVSALYVGGVMTQDQIVENWLTWWTGDMFGIIVFLPLILIAPGNPQRLSWRGAAVGNLPVTAMLILLIPLGLTFYAWKVSSQAADDKSQIQFEALAVESKKALLSRINSYQNALLGGVAYFQGSENITRYEWRRYVDQLHLHDNFPGINGMGWITSLSDNEIESYLRRTRADGAKDFTIRPTDVKDGNYIITYIEPENINKQAVGLNIAFEKNRKQAADLSMQTGKPAITKRIILVQDAEKTPGFLLLHPMYKEITDPDPSAKKWSEFDGWIYAAFIAKNFMSELTQSQGNTLNLRIYDGNAEDADALIYDSRKVQTSDYVPVFSKREQIDVMQQNWLIVWESTPSFEQNAQNTNPILILTGGFLITFLLAMFLVVTNIQRMETIESMIGRRALILPAIILLVLAAGSVSLYRALTDKELGHLQALLTSETSKIYLLMSAETEGKISALKRMVGRTELDADQPIFFWQADARAYIEDLMGLRALVRVNANGTVIQAEEAARNERLIWIYSVLKSANAAFASTAIQNDISILSPPFKLTDQETAFIAYMPLKVRGESPGYLASVFSVGDFFGQTVSPEAMDRYQFRVTFDGQVLNSFGNMTSELAENWKLEKTVQILDKKWNVQIIPTAKFLASQRTSLPNVALIAGFLISFLSAITAHMTLLSRLKTSYLEKSNQRIKQEATRNSTVMNTVSDCVVTINATGQIETINPAGLRIFGYSLDEVLGKNVKMLMPAPYHAGHDGYMSRYLTEGDPKVIGLGRQVSAMRKDGSVFPIDLSVNEMVLDEKRMFVGTIRDTSAAVAAAHALRESNTMKSAILSSTEYLIIATDLNGNVVVFNEAAEKALGYSADEIIGKQTPALWHDPAEVGERARVLSAELDSKVEPGFDVFVRKVEIDGIDENEWTYVRRDGSRFPVMLTVTALRDESQAITGYLGVVLDITKRKEIDRLKSDFVSIVSHELRTPLTSIRGALGLAAGPMAKELPEKANRLIDIAYKNCERLTLLINDILDIDKIESGQMRFEMKPEDLDQILQQAIEVNQPYADKLGVVLKATEIEHGHQVNVDAARLSQVMANLLSNAAKFSNREGAVEVSALCVNGRIRISVKDDGAGIADEFRPQIFGKFSQSDSSSTRIKGGSGLGLHISKQIMERMGGTIGFDTEVGKGSIFWVELPLLLKGNVSGPVDEKDVQRSLLHFTHRQVPTLLHVEDDEDFSRILALTLQGKINVVTASTLKDAEQLLRETHFDLVVLDLELPDGSGLKLVKTISELNGPSVPVMILSATEVSSEVEKTVASVMVKSRATERRIIDKIESLVAA